MDLYIEYVNNNKHHFGWEANTCLLQTHHPKYNKEECEDEEDDDQQSHHIGYTLAQTGSERFHKHMVSDDGAKSKLGLSPAQEKIMKDNNLTVSEYKQAKEKGL